MRKFLLPVINLINVILVSIAFGMANNTSAVDKGLTSDIPLGNYYSNVWNAADKPNVIGIVGFFLFVVAVALILVNFLPLKVRKFLTLLTGGMLIAAGVLMLMTPAGADRLVIKLEICGGLIGQATLTIIAGALSLGMSALELFQKKAE